VVPVVAGSSPVRHLEAGGRGNPPPATIKARGKSVDIPSMALSAAETLEREATVPAVLKTSCVLLTKDLEAHACNLSRVVGQLLVDLCEHSFDGRRIQLGRGYLLPDFPLTQEVIERREPRIVSLFEADVDESEAELLRALRFDSLLMIPLVVDDACWGLFEVYREGTDVFKAEHVARAAAIVESTSTVLEAHHRRSAA
jgi:GAF domain-containing protein